MIRSSGVLMHISSLPSPWGIGTLGKEAYRFIDFLHKAGQKYWQILPVCPTSFGDSPYQSFSTFAGNPYFIDLDLLSDEGFLKPSDYQQLDWGSDPESVDYAKLYQHRFSVLKIAYQRWKEDHQETLSRFRQTQAHWITDYALFMSLKNKYGGKAWYEWPQPYRLREKSALKEFQKSNAEDISFWIFVQSTFYEQWRKVKEYAHSKNVYIIGDLPIYVAEDSADVWARPDMFWMDENLRPVKVAGCPPDAFSKTGQLWGNPLYRWDAMKHDDYSWWIKRMKAASEIYDVVRIDHFRGFDSYYAIPFGDRTAEFGKWMKGPGMDFFRKMKEKLGDIPIIAENLGFLTPSVHRLLKEAGYPGMKILEFAFDCREPEASDYLPHTYEKNCVVYSGTHDNETIMGWMETAAKSDTDYAKEYLRLQDKEGYHWGMIKAAWGSVANLAVVQMQDFLGLGAACRMNTPSTVGKNWKWRIQKDKLTPELSKKIYGITELYGRLATNEKIE